jgi:hypothetical protein
MTVAFDTATSFGLRHALEGERGLLVGLVVADLCSEPGRRHEGRRRGGVVELHGDEVEAVEAVEVDIEPKADAHEVAAGT